MSEYTSAMKETIEFMEGMWQTEIESEGQKESISIFISRENCRLIRKANEKEIENIEFSGNAHWFGNALCFIHSQLKYYIRYANAERLIFGEHRSNVIGDTIWEYEFKRVSNP
ncbi:MAG: hypothetical protein ACHQNT_04890 [Bacteroidia bacterium]